MSSTSFALSSASSGSESESSWPLSNSLSSDSTTNWMTYSQAVIKPRRRTSAALTLSIAVDISYVDAEYLKAAGPQTIQVGGTFAGITIPPAEYILTDDGGTITVQAPRRSLQLEEAMANAWVDAMLGRLRGCLDVVRADAAAIVDIDPRYFKII